MTLTPFDIPPRGVIIPLHRATPVGPARARERHDSGAPVSPIPDSRRRDIALRSLSPDTGARKSGTVSPLTPTTVERRGAIRQPSFDELQRAAADFPDLYAAFREPEVPRHSLADRVVSIFCLAAAAWSIVYFAVQMLRGAL